MRGLFDGYAAVFDASLRALRSALAHAYMCPPRAAAGGGAASPELREGGGGLQAELPCPQSPARRRAAARRPAGPHPHPPVPGVLRGEGESGRGLETGGRDEGRAVEDADAGADTA